jgi:hypothetical protein
MTSVKSQLFGLFRLLWVFWIFSAAIPGFAAQSAPGDGRSAEPLRIGVLAY